MWWFIGAMYGAGLVIAVLTRNSLRPMSLADIPPDSRVSNPETQEAIGKFIRLNNDMRLWMLRVLPVAVDCGLIASTWLASQDAAASSKPGEVTLLAAIAAGFAMTRGVLTVQCGSLAAQLLSRLSARRE